MQRCLILASVTTALTVTACSEAPQEEPSATIDAEASALPTRSAPPSVPPPRTKERAMNSTERRAIEEARARRAIVETQPSSQVAEAPQEADMGTVVRADSAEPPGEEGLTQHDKRAAMDDPAVKLPLGGGEVESRAQDEATQTPSKRTITAPRSGIELTQGGNGLKLVDLAIAAEVKKREPEGVQEHFTTLPRRFHCFCVFENRGETTQVTHIWRRNGRVVSRVELEVGKSPKWRTWSRQRLKPEWTGTWTCEVQSRDGRNLGRATVRAGR